MAIEITEEPQPTPKASGKARVHVTVRLLDGKTGEQVGSTSSVIKENERRLTDFRKY
jgi:hypothetical protein